MIIGILSEDQGSVGAWASCLAKLRTRDIFKGPLFAPMPPNGSGIIVAAKALPALKILRAQGAERIVIFLDIEDPYICAGPRRRELETALLPVCTSLGFGRVDVVLKRVSLENWLISDPDPHLRTRYEVKPGRMKLVRAGSADNVPAQAALKEACQRPPYSKTADPIRILEKNDPYRMALHSRSFRKMLQALGAPAYSNQTAQPVPIGQIPEYALDA